MARPPGPREARPEDKLHDRATQSLRVGGAKKVFSYCTSLISARSFPPASVAAFCDKTARE